jgi:hypothetical protein
MSRRWIYYRLHHWTTTGDVTSPTHGYWRATNTGGTNTGGTGPAPQGPAPGHPPAG